MPKRKATVNRTTSETDIRATIDLDGCGLADIATGIGFLDHMIEQVARHSLCDISLSARGDLDIDAHHTTEDTGIVLGQAFAKALGDRCGINRFGQVLMPMDESLSRVALDCSNRPFLVWDVRLDKEKLGTIDCELFREWFRALAYNAGWTLHVTNLYGDNAHHIVESCFKGLAKAIRQAVAIDGRDGQRVPSTKGRLSEDRP